MTDKPLTENAKQFMRHIQIQANFRREIFDDEGDITEKEAADLLDRLAKGVADIPPKLFDELREAYESDEPDYNSFHDPDMEHPFFLDVGSDYFPETAEELLRKLIETVIRHR